MIHLLIKWVINAVAVCVTAYLLPGIHLDGFKAAMVVALVLGLINVLLKPLLVLLTIPITILTLGLFLLVINAAMLYLTSKLVSGFVIDSFLTALIASVVLTVVSYLLGVIFETR
jgi:putative membrane protein